MKVPIKKKIDKPTNFPVQAITESIELIGKIVKTKGEIGCTIKDIALITGIGEGSLPLPVSTAVQYGIYENTYGAGYRPTSLYHRIATPTFESERSKAIFEALSNPPLYKRLLEVFNGKILPDVRGLSNYLVREFSFKAYALPKITKAFYENFASYIDEANKLRFINTENVGGDKLVTFEEKELKMADAIQPVVHNSSPIAGNLNLPEVGNINGYTIHIFGDGLNTRLSLTDDDDFLILQATINKLKKKVLSQKDNGTLERPVID